MVTMSSGNHLPLLVDPPAAEETDLDSGNTWKGCHLRKRAGGGYEVLSPKNSILVKTVSEWETPLERLETHDSSPETIRNTELVELQVMGRCRHLVGGHPQENCQKAIDKRKDIVTEIHAELKGVTTWRGTHIAAAYIGFDACMQGPVFARGAKPSTNADDTNFSSSNESDEPNKRLELKISTLLGDPTFTPMEQAFIPHFAVASRLNIYSLAKLLAGSPLENVLEYPGKIKEYSQHVEDLVQHLREGNSLMPFVYKDPEIGSRVRPGANLTGLLQNNSRPRSNNNRPLADIACDATVFAQKDNGHLLSGYRYKVALTQALKYPYELLIMLRNFARRHPNDILPLSTLLLGCHLWADITAHRTRCMEEFFEIGRDESAVPQVPHIPLAVCLVYYPHWLKWTEWMGLSEFPHPFRFMSQALKFDLDHEAIGVDPDAIDQSRAWSLIAQAKSVIPLMEPMYRVEIRPCYMPGSKMPPIFGSLARYPKKVPLALTGLENIQCYGLKSYAQPEGSTGDIYTRLQPILRTSRYTTVAIPRHVKNLLDITTGELFASAENPREEFNNKIHKRGMEPVGSEGLWTGRPHKRHRGLDLTQFEKSMSKTPAEVMSSTSAGPGEVPTCSKYEEILKIWAEARHGVAHWAHQEGLQQFKHLLEAKLRKEIEVAFDQEETEAMDLLKDFGICEASSVSFPLSAEDLNVDVSLRFGRVLGLRPPEELVSDFWTSHFMPQCLDNGETVYRRARSIQSALQRCRNCGELEQRKILRDEVIMVLSELWTTPPNGWREKLEQFVKDDEDTFAASSSTEEGSLYEESTSDEESSSDEEIF